MQLLPKLADKIIREVRLIIKEDLIVVDENGEIIASTKEERVKDFHAIAKQVVKEKKKYYITEEEALAIKNVKAGINLPIFFESRVIGVIGITGTPSEVEGYAELLRKMTELMIRETHYNEQKEWEIRGLEAYFYEWVYSKNVDQAFIHRGHLLGVSVGESYLCILLDVETEKEPQRVQAAMMDWFRNLFPKDHKDIFIRWGEGRFLLLKQMKEGQSKHSIREDLSRWKRYFESNHQMTISAGMSKSLVVYDLYSSYVEAEKALKVAKRSEPSVILYEELVLDIILEEINQDTRKEFVNQVLARIEHKPELLATLEAFLLQNQSAKDTSKYMNIHINTLHYRLKQIKELTHIDPRNSEGITLFYLSLCFLGE